MADDSERRGLEALIRVAGLYKTTARALLGMAWVADGLSATEADFLNALARLTNASVAERVVALPWVADGISDTEASVISSIGGIASWSAAVAESVIALPWIADSISDTEADSIYSLWGIAASSVAAAESVIALPWVADSISDTEADSIYSLWGIAFRDADAALQVVGMPFLQTLEEADLAALRSLSGATSSFADQFADIMSRPMLKDGITDDEAPIVSMLSTVLRHAPDRVDRLLDPDATTVERRTIELPLAGEVDLVIVRTYLGVRRSMDLLENAVREVENLMGEPLPTQYVGLLYENSVASHAAGTNFWGFIAIRPEYDTDDGDHYGYSAARIIAHEVSHYYWRGNADWIDEGVANLMESAIENRRVGTPIDFTRRSCEFARSLKELEERAPRKGTPAFICNYSLGEGLFVSLLRTLGEDAFWEGARRLYVASLDADGGAGIEEVRQAFGRTRLT